MHQPFIMFTIVYRHIQHDTLIKKGIGTITDFCKLFKNKHQSHCTVHYFKSTRMTKMSQRLIYITAVDILPATIAS